MTQLTTTEDRDMNDSKKLYGLGTSKHTVEIVKEAFRKNG